MSAQRLRQRPAALDIPQDDRRVSASAGEQSAIRAERQAFDRFGVGDRRLTDAEMSGNVPEDEWMAPVARHRQQLAVRAQGGDPFD